MTGRDLIIFILENGLEDQPIIKDGKIIGFVTPDEAAVKMNVGTATIYVWIWQKRIPAVRVGDRFYIPATFERPIDND